MPSRKLGRPDLVVGAGGVASLPHVGDIERMLDYTGAHLFSEQALQQVLVERERALRKDRVAELLKLVQNFVIQSGVMMIGAAQHHDTDAVFTLELIEH